MLSNNQPITISELNQCVAQRLQRDFPLLSIQAEIAQFTKAASGHCYLILKDASAQAKGIMYRRIAQSLDWEPRIGDAIEARVMVSLYEPRGEYQLQIESMRQAGTGNLYEQFIALRNRLQQQGLFSSEHKQALPHYPRCVGIVTSLKAAALRDVLDAFKRRAPHVKRVVFPGLVQGPQAPAQLIQALAQAQKQCDVILLVRGGGTLEDLWAFNDESLAHALHSTLVPIVSGVGHETDTTIVDFVADVHAATPTAAAELVTAHHAQLTTQIANMPKRLEQACQRLWTQSTQRHDRLTRALDAPKQWLALKFEQVHGIKHRTLSATSACLHKKQSQCSVYKAQLQALDPKKWLLRGFSWVIDAQGQVVSSVRGLQPQEELQLQFSDGYAQVTVNTTQTSCQHKTHKTSKT